MTRPLRPFRLLAAVLAVALLGAPAPLGAQPSDETAAAAFREGYAFIRDEALRPPDPQTLLRQAIAVAQQTLLDTDVKDSPRPPILVGREADDLEAVAAYVQAAVRAVGSRQAETLLASVLRAMLRELADPQAAVFTPAEFARYVEELRGEHVGIGAQVDLVNGEILISDLTDVGPAKRVGTQVGDVILEVDGRSIAGRGPDQVLELLRGRPGTSVALTLRRPSGAVTRLTVNREVVRENPTRSRMLDTRLGYLRLLEFSELSSRDVGQALGGLRRRGAQGLVLDLRENLGGLVDEAVGVGSFFLSDGVVAMEERRGKLVPLEVQPVDQRFSGPVVVLVSGFTASSAEIVAGALQDAGSILVGAKTFGKATVQSVSPSLTGGWGLRVTFARYYTRRGRRIEGVGLIPNVAISMSENLIQSSRDVQLQEAQTQLRTRLEATTRTRP